ncbi:DUF2314 domain-containing protein [Chitinophaga sp. 212800008-4]|uniref:DUF2314 domain-containing protein n=1 Tax=unclassified Chitinophaga TaxID=2619133 RepID=UPI0030D41F19
MEENKIFYAEASDEGMERAFEKARETFKYFWRESSWEQHRIVPALGMAAVKIAFSQETDDPGKPIVEHMWVNEVGFDGDNIFGVLINSPNDLTNVREGDHIAVPLYQLSDWLFTTMHKTFGGFTIHYLRSQMDDAERKEHDEAWGLDFGDFNNIEVVTKQGEHPEYLVEHPMSINMKDKLKEFLTAHPAEINAANEDGYTFLHRETIAGNKSSVEALLEAGADRQAVTRAGKTALDFARQLKWEHLIPVLEK